MHGRVVARASPVAVADQLLRTSSVLVPCAYSFPAVSTTRPSAVATVLPLCTTAPVHRRRPVDDVIGRTKFTFTSTVV
jgi:hypothetical protein